MEELEFTDEELQIAQAINVYPEYVCLDALGLFDAVDGGYEERDEYGVYTARVDVCQVELTTAKEQQTMRRKFKFRFLFKVISGKRPISPNADVVMLDEYPLSEDDVLGVCRKYLKAVGYPADAFLWGDRVVKMDG